MSIINTSYTDFLEIKLHSLKHYKYIGVVGSRELRKNNTVMNGIHKFSYKLSHKLMRIIVTGGAYGPDCAGMAGALNVDITVLRNSRIIPMESRKNDKFQSFFSSISKEAVFIDKKSCVLIIGKLIVFYPNFDNGYHVKEYIIRDEKIAKFIDVMFAFWDGKSTGTKKTVDHAVKAGKKVYLIEG